MGIEPCVSLPIRSFARGRHQRAPRLRSPPRSSVLGLCDPVSEPIEIARSPSSPNLTRFDDDEGASPPLAIHRVAECSATKSQMVNHVGERDNVGNGHTTGCLPLDLPVGDQPLSGTGHLTSTKPVTSGSLAPEPIWNMARSDRFTVRDGLDALCEGPRGPCSSPLK